MHAIMGGLMAPHLRATKQLDNLMASQRQSQKARDRLIGKTSAIHNIQKPINRWT